MSIIQNFSFLFALSHMGIDGTASDSPKLFLIMLDGFRHDLVTRQNKKDLPNFNSIFYEGGSVASYVQPIFPSVSFPSWTTIGTGATQ